MSRRFLAAGGALGLALALLISTGGGTALASSSAAHSSKGRTITFAEAAGGPPNYIFPLESAAYYTGANSEDFSYLFWLPIYWFGQGSSPNINWSLSLGDKPVYSDHNRVVSITLKPYKWSDGKAVTADDVLFWMQLLKANEEQWGAYVPGEFPANVTSMRTVGKRTIVFRIDRTYSSLWFTYNELSQLIAIPQQTWDKTSASGHVGNYAATPAGARAVFKFLNAQSENLSTYATNPLWKVVDGPFKLSAFTTTGQATLVPNHSYSGSKITGISKFVEIPFTSTDAEFDDLESGTGVDVGYIPINDLKASGRLSSLGYREQPQKSWSITYINLNFHNSTATPLFNQLYLRQAMQDLIDQKAYDKDILQGAGWPTYGPVPSYPATKYLSPGEKANPYPYSPSKARKLLKSHGWTIRHDGVDTCTRPGTKSNDCGAGIKKGAKLLFKMLVNSGTSSGDTMAQAMDAAWYSVGIRVVISYESSNDVFAAVTSCAGASPSSSACSWQMGDAGAGTISWFYSDDYLPTGESLFAIGGTSNAGQYDNKALTKLIYKTDDSSSLPLLYKYENETAKLLPVLWMPSTATIVVWKKDLKGVLPLSSVFSITPWMWHFSK